MFMLLFVIQAFDKVELIFYIASLDFKTENTMHICQPNKYFLALQQTKICSRLSTIIVFFLVGNHVREIRSTLREVRC